MDSGDTSQGGWLYVRVEILRVVAYGECVLVFRHFPGQILAGDAGRSEVAKWSSCKAIKYQKGEKVDKVKKVSRLVILDVKESFSTGPARCLYTHRNHGARKFIVSRRNVAQ